MKKYVILGIVFVILLGMLGVFFFFPKPETHENEWIELSLDDERVKELYERANPSDSVISLSDVYRKGTFSNEFILGTAFVDYLKEKETEYIPEEEIALRVHKIFGNVTFAHDSGYIVSQYLCAFKYDKGSKSYTYLTGCDGSLSSYFSRVLVSAKKNETEYILTEKLIYVKSNWEDVIDTEEKKATVKVYADINESKLIDEISYEWEKEDEPSITVQDYLDEASSYEYHFVFDGENYVYQKLEKVN